MSLVITSPFRTIILLAFLLQLPVMGDSKLEFFENRIRPVLAENCYECHNSIKQAKSGLVLDYKHGIIKGGERGPAISLTNPKASLLLRVLKHEISDLKMPKGGPKITNKIINDFGWEKRIILLIADHDDTNLIDGVETFFAESECQNKNRNLVRKTRESEILENCC